MTAVPVDIDLPATDDPPSIAYPRDAFAGRPTFACVVPPGGSEEDARLFAVCTSGSRSAGGPFQSGARPAALPVTGHVVEPLDPETAPRLLERGCHPGDFIVAGSAPDRFGRPETASLMFFDLSRGMPSGSRLVTPVEVRLGLAMACAQLDAKEWQAAADLFDPASLMRDRAVTPLGGNPMTEEGFHRFMADGATKADRRMDVDNQPIRDYRLLGHDELLDEAVRDARAVLYGSGDMPPDGAAARLLHLDIGKFVRDARRDGLNEAPCRRLQGRVEEVLRSDDVEPALSRLAAGAGPGAVCWRNLFAAGGILDVLSRRAENADCDSMQIAQASELPQWARQMVLDPRQTLTHRPQTLDNLEFCLQDPHRPYLSLPASRLAAAPALKARLASLPPQRLADLLANTELLLLAFDAIENSSVLCPEARDSVAVGWHALAGALNVFDPGSAPARAARAPEFVTEAARSRAFLASGDPFPQDHAAPRGP